MLRRLNRALVAALVLVATAQACDPTMPPATSCHPVWLQPTTMGNPAIVKGVITLAFNPNCNGTWSNGNVELWAGCPDSLSRAECVGRQVYTFFVGPNSTFTFDTRRLPNAQYDFAPELFNSSGAVLGGSHWVEDGHDVDHDIVLTVAN